MATSDKNHLEKIESFLRCSACKRGMVSISAESAVCSSCKKTFPIRDGKIFFVEPPALWPKSSEKHENERSWSKLRKGEFKFTNSKIHSLSKNSVVFDLGAGESHFYEALKHFESFISVDLFPYDRVDVVADFTKEIPIQDASGDVVVISNVLEHIREPVFFLSECHRILKPGGKIVGTIPFLLEVHQSPYDYNRFTHFMLKYVLERVGFDEIEIAAVSSPFAVYKSITGTFFRILKLNHSEKYFDRIKISLAWKITKFTQSLFRNSYQAALATDDFTLGYGFFAKKKQ